MGKGLELVQRLELMKSLCIGKKVIRLGCTNWPYTKAAIDGGVLLHSDLAAVADELYGFDFDQEGIDVLASEGFSNLFQADLEHLEKIDLDETFDVIIAGDMIEHLNNPGL